MVFKNEQNAVWGWRGNTDFLLYQLWLTGGPAAVDPVLADRCSLSPCPNNVRVFGMVNSFSRFHPGDYGERFYTELKPFARYVFSRWGMRIQFTIFADGGDCGFNNPADQDAHAIRVANEIYDEPNVFGQVANEPSQHVNLPGGDARAYEIYLLIKAPGRMISTGALDWEHPGDYIDQHPPRSEDWPRKANDLKDSREATGRPAVADEIMGAAEEFIDGKRDTNPRNFADFAAVAQMEGNGSTFHSDSGILSRPFQPVQRSCAQAFFAAAAWVPPDATLAPYIRGGSVPGCNWLGESICQHDDASEVRTYAKILGNNGWVCQVQTARLVPTPCPGWAVYQPGPSTGLTEFVRV
jgi:hypothetical protein